MTDLLQKAGTSFLRAFGVSFLFFATGILSAPDGQAAWALSVAALAGSIAAGLRALQVFVPAISFAGIVDQPIAAWLDSFSRVAIASFLVTITGWLAAPDLSTWKSVLLAATIGAVTAGVRALQGLLTKGEDPAPAKGLKVPEPKVA